MNITNITSFLRVVTDLQPSSTAPFLTSMNKPPPQKKLQYRQQNYINILTNGRKNNNALVVQVMQKS
jgi:hypothetical protein